MTTTPDPFTTAARKRAEKIVPLDDGEPNLIFRDRRQLVEMAEWARAYLAEQEASDAELDALYDTFIAHDKDELNTELTRTEDGAPYSERICSECGETVWIKGEHYWAAIRASSARKRHHVARAALSAARRAGRGEG